MSRLRPSADIAFLITIIAALFCEKGGVYVGDRDHEAGRVVDTCQAFVWKHTPLDSEQ